MNNKYFFILIVSHNSYKNLFVCVHDTRLQNLFVFINDFDKLFLQLFVLIKFRIRQRLDLFDIFDFL